TTVIACGAHVDTAIQALEQSDAAFGLYSARAIKPLDEKTLNHIAKVADTIIVMEDNAVIGGLGALIEDYYAKENIGQHVIKMGVPDRFVTHGRVEMLNKEIGLTAEDLVKKVTENETR
ncbi:MAG: transketolase C-terminal domain-containing protein, partial [Eubacteriales bacterium]